MYLVAIRPAEVFQALADPTRLRVVRLLATTKEESCLCEMVDSLLEPQYKLSRHLKILRQSGLLTSQKEGRWVYHRLVTGPRYVKDLCSSVKNLEDNDRVFANDLARFNERIKLRKNGRCQVGIQNALLAVNEK